MAFDDSNVDRDNSKFNRSMSAESGPRGPSQALIALIVVVVLAVIFVLQNGNRVNTQFLFFDTNAKVWTTIFVAIVVGIVLDRLFSIWWRRRRTRKNDDI